MRIIFAYLPRAVFAFHHPFSFSQIYAISTGLAGSLRLSASRWARRNATMTDRCWAPTRAARYGQTTVQALFLRPLPLELLQAYAAGRRLFFSPAIEALAVVGLRVQSAEQFPLHLMIAADYAPLLNHDYKQRMYTLMTDLLNKPEDRYGKTMRKNVTLTHEAIEAIKIYAKAKELNFSVAIETLALIGLGHRTAESLPRMAAEMLENIVARYFERQTRLSALALMAAEEANFKADFLVLQTLWREARLDPEGFAGNMTVSLKPDAEPDARARQLLSEIKALAQAGGLKRLKESPAPLLEPTNEEAADA
jgi:hypothetical protein